jgi:outer membrane protein OmpA-like peptidoglycan-associated protein
LAPGGLSPRRRSDLPLGWIVALGVVLAILVLLFIIGSTGGTDEVQADHSGDSLVEIVRPALTRAGYGDVTIQADGRTIILSGELATRADVVAASAVVNSLGEVASVDNRLTYAGEPALGDLPGEGSSPISGGVTSSADLLLQARLSTIAARDPIQFETGSNELTPESASTIAQVAQLLLDNPTVRIEIGGHTDSDGEEDANQALSQSRAEAVLAALTAAGIEPQRMIAIGYGETLPIGSNETQDGKARNRRIEFLVLV